MDVSDATESMSVWKSLAMKHIFDKWKLATNLGKMKKYIQSKFLTPTSKIAEVEPAKEADVLYRHSTKGTLTMVLATTMSGIKSICPQEVGSLLTKAWIQNIGTHANTRPHVPIALPYLEYLVKLQRYYEDMERWYNVVRR